MLLLVELYHVIKKHTHQLLFLLGHRTRFQLLPLLPPKQLLIIIKLLPILIFWMGLLHPQRRESRLHETHILALEVGVAKGVGTGFWGGEGLPFGLEGGVEEEVRWGVGSGVWVVATVEEWLLDFLVIKVLVDDGLLAVLDKHLLEHVGLDVAFFSYSQLTPISNPRMISPKHTKILLIQLLIRHNLLHQLLLRPNPLLRRDRRYNLKLFGVKHWI